MVGKVRPGLGHEAALAKAGYLTIAGVDEAGRGAWAGPLVAAAVVLPDLTMTRRATLLRQLRAVRDSKQLQAAQREAALITIERLARAIGVGWVPAPELDQLGLGAANRLAWERAIAALAIPPDHLLLDAFRLPASPLPQTSIVRGDSICLSIAAASIVAKVTRDRALMVLAAQYPAYQFARHKGYGTAQHQAALAEFGACPEHRQSFAPLKRFTLARSVDE